MRGVTEIFAPDVKWSCGICGEASGVGEQSLNEHAVTHLPTDFPGVTGPPGSYSFA